MVVLAGLLIIKMSQAGAEYKIDETDKITPIEHAARRNLLRESLPADTLVFIPTNPLHQRSNDTDYPFRPNSYFWYLSGFEEPDSALLMSSNGLTVNGKTAHEVLFVNDKEPSQETWTGVRMGPSIGQKMLGIELVLSNTRFEEVLKSANEKQYATIPTPTGQDSVVKKFQTLFNQWCEGKTKEKSVLKTLDVMRSIKSPAEILLHRKSMAATLLGHTEAIKSCEPGGREYEIQALVEYIFARNGCESVAYGSIVGSGENSCTLHYMSNRKKIEANDMVCMDVGAEYHGYASDVTRSYPASGKFSRAQKEIYELVQKAQQAGIEASQVGSPFNSADKVARQVISDGLLKLGIIKNAKQSAKYFMHGTSHYVGLDVHDTGDYGILKENQIITVEPGIYIKAGSDCDKSYWDIGVRIEDCILIKPGGPENLSRSLPRGVPEIEALMQQNGLGNRREGKIIMDFLSHESKEHHH
jgi:Xaa-Pro aminopeptidase